MATFQTMITERRKELKMTQRALAEKLNVSDKTVSKWETGNSYPDLLLFKDLAAALEVSPSFLLGAEDLSEERKNVREALDAERISGFVKDMMGSSFLILEAALAGLAAFLVPSLMEDPWGTRFAVVLAVGAVAMLFISLRRYLLGVFRFQTFYRSRFDGEQYLAVFLPHSLRFWDAFCLAWVIVTMPFGHLDSITPALIFVILIIKWIVVAKNRYVPKRDGWTVALVLGFPLLIAGSVLFSFGFNRGWVEPSLWTVVLQFILRAGACVSSGFLTGRMEKRP